MPLFALAGGVDQPIHVSHLCLICGFVDICVCLYLACYVKINQYRTEDNCVHMSYHGADQNSKYLII